jgi:hypothetical protein
MPLIEDDDVVQTLAADRADGAFPAREDERGMADRVVTRGDPKEEVVHCD